MFVECIDFKCKLGSAGSRINRIAPTTPVTNNIYHLIEANPPLYSFPWEYKPSACNTETLCKRKVLCKIFLRRKTWSPERSHDRRPPRRVARIRHSSGKIGGTYPANWEYAKNTWKRPSSTKISGETLCYDNRRLIGTPLIVIARQSQKNRD